MGNGGSQHLPVVVEDFAENGEWRAGAAVGGGGGGAGAGEYVETLGRVVAFSGREPSVEWGGGRVVCPADGRGPHT